MAASSLALTVLTVLALAAPWAFGGVDPLPRFLIAVLALATSAVALAAWSRGCAFSLPALPLWPLGGLLALGLAQLLPLPEGVLRVLAPASAEVWFPSAPAARAVLGEGPRPVSVDPGATLAGLLLAAGLVGLGLIALPALSRPIPLLRAAAVLTLGSALLAAYGIAARNRYGALLYGQFAVPTVSPFGPFVSKNHFAGYVAPACLLALGLASGLAGRARSREWTRDPVAPAVVLALVGALVMALSLLVSHSRGGVAAGAAGLVLLLAGLAAQSRRQGRARSLVPAAAVAVSALVALAVVMPEAARARVGSLEGAGFRLEVWRDSLALSAKSPLVGQGFSAFADAFPRAKRAHGELRVEHAENEYVEMLVEGGLLGLGLCLLAVVLPLRRLLVVRGRLEPARRGVMLGGLAGLAALAIHSAFDFNLRIPSNAALATLIAAFAAAGAGLREVAVPAWALRGLALVLAAATAATAAGGPAVFDRAAAARRARAETQSAALAGSPEVRRLRAERAASEVERLSRARPAWAEGWLLRAALAASAGDAGAARSLAGHAIGLDPSRADLVTRARAIMAAPADGSPPEGAARPSS